MRNWFVVVSLHMNEALASTFEPHPPRQKDKGSR